MNFLYFEDTEFDDLFLAINALQLCFHPTYAPDGTFSMDTLFELQSSDRDITIIADKNLVSPICEIARIGTLKDKFRLQKVALFVTWAKYLNARLSCGIGLWENDTAGLSAATGEESRLQFLHGVDKIPALIWKELAFGYRDCVPEPFLFSNAKITHKSYALNDNLLLLCNEVAILKITQLIRTSGLAPIDKFIMFMIWYTDHLDIAESIMIYAALVFANIPHVSLPKNVQSRDSGKVIAGIKNQAWDITYITTWSMLYYNEDSNSCNMFATDDITQKIITINTIPPGECMRAIEAIFKTKSQRQKLEQLSKEKLGAARVRPFQNLEEKEIVTMVKSLLSQEYDSLQRPMSTP